MNQAKVNLTYAGHCIRVEEVPWITFASKASDQVDADVAARCSGAFVCVRASPVVQLQREAFSA